MVTVSDVAAEQLKDVIKNFEQKESKSGLSLRVFVQGQCGCGAVHYGLGIDDQSREGDTQITDYGFSILVDADSKALVEGAEIDYVQDAGRQGFVVKGAEGSGCNCGH